MKKLGFGFMRLPLKDKEDMESINIEELCEMVDYFLKEGFTYFDTAYPYHKGLSEAALKEALTKRYPRESYILADKMPTFIVKSPEDYKRIFNEQLEKCGVEYFDYYMLHNLGAVNYKNTLKHGGFEFIKEVKNSKKAKHIGFSFHDSAELLDEILTKYPEMEFVQLQINYVDWESHSIQSKKCYEVARKHNKPVIVMEPVKGGSLANVSDEIKSMFEEKNKDMSPASWAVRFAASLEGVMMVLSGMSDINQIKDNTSFMKDFTKLDNDELRLINTAGEIINSNTAIPCTACQYCVDDCPKKIPIPKYFTIYNQLKQFGNTIINRLYYLNVSNTNGMGKASECIGCRQCEKHCPQHIEIIEALKNVVLDLEKK